LRAIRPALRVVAPWAALAGLGLAVLPFGVMPTSAAVVGHAMSPAVGSVGQFRYLGDVRDLGLAPFPCQNTVPAACFGPDQLRNAYGIQPVLNAGVTGAGRTIVIIDAFQSPTIQKDLAAFDAIWHLPAPPAFNIISPDGLTPFDITDAIQVGWSLEISVDVEWAHAVAPGAKIVLVLAKSGSDVDMLQVTEYAVEHNLNGSRGDLGDVFSQSFGEAEQCAPMGFFAREHLVFNAATRRGITLVAASGDWGATQLTCDGSSLLASAATSTPASDPDVTAVGGTRLLADGTSGAYQSESGWSGSGGGFSAVYRRPNYQASIQTPKAGRGLPDVAYDADGRSGPIVAWSVLRPPSAVGLGVVGGTSAGPPQWAAITALADQTAGRRLGQINKSLYFTRKSDDQPSAFHDITSGNNSFGGVTGFSAVRGWDPVTGLGTPNVAVLIPLLVKDGDLGQD
jgi:subtilase family serine protease